MDLPTGTPCQLCWGLCAQPPWCCALGTGLRYRSPFLLLGMGRAPSGTQGAPIPVPPTWGWSHLVPCATHPVLRPPRPCVTHPGPWPPLSAGVASRKNPSQAVGSKKQEWSWLWSTCTRSSCSERDKTTAGSSLGKAQAPQGTSEGSQSQMQILQEGPAAWECKWHSNLWGRQNVRLVWGFTHKQGLAAERGSAREPFLLLLEPKDAQGGIIPEQLFQAAFPQSPNSAILAQISPALPSPHHKNFPGRIQNVTQIQFTPVPALP